MGTMVVRLHFSLKLVAPGILKKAVCVGVRHAMALLLHVPPNGAGSYFFHIRILMLADLCLRKSCYFVENAS